MLFAGSAYAGSTSRVSTGYQSVGSNRGSSPQRHHDLPGPGVIHWRSGFPASVTAQPADHDRSANLARPALVRETLRRAYLVRGSKSVRDGEKSLLCLAEGGVASVHRSQRIVCW